MGASLFLAIIAASFLAWAYLLLGRGMFWRASERLDFKVRTLNSWPEVVAVVPARNEADVIGISMRSLLLQDYPGAYSIVLVDDQSDDETESLAQATASGALPERRQLVTLRGSPPPPGWTGKLWAVAQGLRKAEEIAPRASYVFLTDADIEHDADTLRLLVLKAEFGRFELVSLMVLLHCATMWERLLIPSFVFFFQKLYPFSWVRQPMRRTAAAAGGCMLVNRRALARIGGIEAIRHELIDDCALARAIKRDGHVWLGLTESSRSLRRYEGLGEVWKMVARSAYAQLHYSPTRLLGTVVGMAVIYLAPPASVIGGAMTGAVAVAVAGGLTWMLMACAYLPTLRLYRQAAPLALTLPLAALLYTLMTIESALRYWRGRGGEWKARHYAPK